MIYFFCQFSLKHDQVIHFIRILHDLGIAEGKINLLVFFQKVHYLLNTLLDYFNHGLFRIHLWFLLQIANRISGRPYNFPLISGLNTGDDFHQGGLT